jgi:hypothetical protein
MAMDGLPTPDLEVIETQFVLFFPKALFNRPAGISHIQQPFQWNTGRRVGNEELQFTTV